MLPHYTLMCGYTASTLYTISLIPQIFKVAQTQSAADISVWFLFLHLSAGVLMFTYALSLGAYPLLINNGANVLCCVVLFVLYFRYAVYKPSIYHTLQRRSSRHMLDDVGDF